ncbi:MAG TPA: ATPase, T2SS/T4P/T4SS family [Patescibacteria group bacterium]
MATAQKSAKSVDDILFEKGLLTSDQFSTVKVEANSTGQPVEKILMDQGIVSEEEIGKARAQHLRLPFITVADKIISSDALTLVPEAVAKRYNLIPFEKDESSLSVAMVDPQDVQVLEFVEQKTGLKIKPHVGISTDIQRAITEQYAQSLSTEVTAALKEAGASTGQVVDETVKQAELDAQVIREAPVAKIVSQLLEYGIKSKASDVHIEALEGKTRVRYRLDGILHEKLILPQKVHDAVVSRIKILSGMKIDEKRVPQDGRFNFTIGSESVDLRVSSLPTVHGEKIVMRLLKKSGGVPTMADLGLRGTALKNLESNILRPHGIILITGPTGSGKTTTLYSILTKINSVRVNIVTLEDPVEYQMGGINQVQINPAAGLTFASGLRSFLRQDPNIIMVGEIRDVETADLAIQASLTGHLVFSTLHTNNSAGALPRLLDMGAEPFLIASTVTSIVAQRVVRKICENCKETYEPVKEVEEDIKKVLGELYKSGLKKLQLFRGKGCEECNSSGYTGRIGIFEVLVVSEKIGRLVMEHGTSQQVEQQSVIDGMVTLKQDGYLKAVEGITTIEEVLRVAQE